jgi:hypothetical protein
MLLHVTSGEIRGRAEQSAELCCLTHKALGLSPGAIGGMPVGHIQHRAYKDSIHRLHFHTTVIYPVEVKVH